MRLLDWAIVVGYLAWVVVDGVKRAKSTDKLEGYFLADRRLPWWAVGLSVMATQMRAGVVMISLPRCYAVPDLTWFIPEPIREDLRETRPP